MAKRLRRTPHHPSKVFGVPLRKELIDYLITMLETIPPERVVSDEEDDWDRKVLNELHNEALEALKRTDIED